MYNLAVSSALITIGVKPVKAQRAPLDVVRNSFAIFMFMRRCTLLYKVLLHSFSSASIQTGAPYNRSGKIAPLYEEHQESKESFAIKKYLLIIGKKKNMQVLSHTFTYFST